MRTIAIHQRQRQHPAQRLEHNHARGNDMPRQFSLPIQRFFVICNAAQPDYLPSPHRQEGDGNRDRGVSSLVLCFLAWSLASYSPWVLSRCWELSGRRLHRLSPATGPLSTPTRRLQLLRPRRRCRQIRRCPLLHPCPPLHPLAAVVKSSRQMIRASTLWLFLSLSSLRAFIWPARNRQQGHMRKLSSFPIPSTRFFRLFLVYLSLAAEEAA
jgi:hypothetical protein